MDATGAPIIIANDTDMSLSESTNRIIRVPKTVDCLQGALNSTAYLLVCDKSTDVVARE